MQPAAPWRRYVRFRRNPVYQAVLTGLGLMGAMLVLHPFHADWVDLAVALALPLGLGLIAWSDKRAERVGGRRSSA
jgi:hypothetical protein